MQKETFEQQLKRGMTVCHDTLRSKLFWWMKAPCPPSECHMKMTHRHFSCFTCPERRFRSQPNAKWYRHKQAMILLRSASGRGFLLPKRYMTYGLFIPVGIDGQAVIWKRIILKLWMTIAERIAEV